jgi:hypothetical protein
VLALKERMGAILRGESEAVRSKFRGDVRRRRFQVIAIRVRTVPFTVCARWTPSNWLVHWIYTKTN